MQGCEVFVALQNSRRCHIAKNEMAITAAPF